MELSRSFKQPHEIGIECGGWCGEQYAPKEGGGWLAFIPELWCGNALIVLSDYEGWTDPGGDFLTIKFDEGHELEAVKVANALAAAPCTIEIERGS